MMVQFPRTGLGVSGFVCHAGDVRGLEGIKRLSSEAARRLASEAAALCIEGGIGHLTMRSVADRVGLTPPAVVYHFSNRDNLLLAALEALRGRLATAYTGIADQIVVEGGANMDAHAVLCAALMDLVTDHGTVFTAIDDLARTLATTGQAGTAAMVVSGVYDDIEAFWLGLPAVRVLAEDMRVLCAAVASGLIPFLNLDRSALRRNAMIIQTMTRLFARLRGEEVILQAVPENMEKPAWAPRPEGKQAIVEATILLAGRIGIAGLTHRNIAAEAGLSAAATTYFYPAKEDIIVDAAREVQARAIDAVVTGHVPLPGIMSRITLDDMGEERGDLAALTAFMNAAVSQPDLEVLASTFLQIRGLAAVRWLRMRGYKAVDRIDGIIWSAATTSLTQRALMLPQAERATVLDQASDQRLVRLFG